jgi:MoaA/NifB/PqqE/SkfB family radical SAM enzyme
VTFISVTNRCNLCCQGCWVTPSDPPHELSLTQLDNIVAECKRYSARFFGILGGEPLLHPELITFLERHPDCYFQLFTNGLLLNDEAAAVLRRLGNVTPLISVEGDVEVSDQRRGGSGVHEAAMRAMSNCRRHGLIFGVATSVCRSNMDALVNEEFVQDLIKRGALYLWYYIYRPAGPRPTPELALAAEQIAALRRFLVENRARYPILLLDAYWDEKGRAVCPAAMGLSHHVSPAGALEACPPLQFAKDRVGDAADFGDLVADSEFLRRFRDFAVAQTRGCVLLERPRELHRFLTVMDASDSSGRGTAFAELAAMQCCAGHHQPGHEIAERHWLYRFAKRHWFFGFGAYG